MLIQKLRLQRGWSQEDLAELSGVSVRTIQRLERGKSGSLDSLKALAAVFEIDFNRLKEPAMDTPHAGDLRPDEALALAHVRKVKGFYIHLCYYVGIVVVLGIFNAVSDRSHWWSLWVAGTWGVAVIIHAVSVFNLIPFMNGDWEKRQVEKYLQRNL